MGRDFRVFFNTLHFRLQFIREYTRERYVSGALTVEPRSTIASCVYVHHPLARIKRDQATVTCTNAIYAREAGYVLSVISSVTGSELGSCTRRM